MPKVMLPDGTIAHFSDDTPLEQIEEILQARFPPDEPEPVCQLPQTLDPGETFRHENGATITHLDEIERYVVRDAGGTAQGFRSTFADAFALVDCIRPLPPRRRPLRRPAPSKPAEPVTAIQLNNRIDQLIRRDEAQRRREHVEQQKLNRLRNRSSRK